MQVHKLTCLQKRYGYMFSAETKSDVNKKGTLRLDRTVSEMSQAWPFQGIQQSIAMC